MTREYELIIGTRTIITGRRRVNGERIQGETISFLRFNFSGRWRVRDRFHRRAPRFRFYKLGINDEAADADCAEERVCARTDRRLDNLCEHDRSGSAIVNAKRAWIFALRESRSFALSFLFFFLSPLLSPTSRDDFSSSTKSYLLAPFVEPEVNFY